MPRCTPRSDKAACHPPSRTRLRPGRCTNIGTNVVAASTRVTREYSKSWPKPGGWPLHTGTQRSISTEKGTITKVRDHHDCRVLHVGDITSLSVRRVALNARGRTWRGQLTNVTSAITLVSHPMPLAYSWRLRLMFRSNFSCISDHLWWTNKESVPSRIHTSWKSYRRRNWSVEWKNLIQCNDFWRNVSFRFDFDWSMIHHFFLLSREELR